MSSPLSTASDTRSKEYVEWMSAVWKANDLRNQFLKQLEECDRLHQKLN
jgi:hypothetical protein